MLEEKKTLLAKNVFFALRRKRKEDGRDRIINNIALVLSVFFSLFIIGIFYFASGTSDIFRIVCHGNFYLRDEDVLELSGLSIHDEFLLTFPRRVEKRLLSDPLIEDASIEKKEGRIIDISIREKKVIGYINESGQPTLLLADDERIPLERDRLYLVAKVPFIDGFSAEDLMLIEKNLAERDARVINEISEIHFYPDLRFQSVQLIMRDGNYIFSSAYGLPLLDRYYDMESSYISEGMRCYYFEDISGNAYTSACPWQPQQEEPTEPIQEETDED